MKRMFIVLGVIFAIVAITFLALDMPGGVWIGLGIVVVVGFIVAPLFKQADEMLASGAIINRDANFMENVQRFSLSMISTESLITAMKNEGLPFPGLEWKTGNDAMSFKYSDWTAQLIKVESNDDFARYEFKFLQWKANQYGGSVTLTQMNQLLTTIEKAFINLDSNTKVQSERAKISTKSSFL